MFARNVVVRLKANMLTQFTETLENEVLPLLQKQPGFRDEITLSNESGTFVNAISIWDSKEQADAYDKSAYPEVVKALEKFTDGAPKVHPSTIVNSTLHKPAPVAA
jgi:heme-degrading monooxygenase HmoA